MKPPTAAQDGQPKPAPVTEHVIGHVVEQANEQVNEQAFDLAKEMADLAQLQAEAMGWLPLEAGVYLHVSDENATEVLVVGVPQFAAGFGAVLLVG